MIYEFALEPTLLNNWKDYRYFVEKFGIEHGRLISRYPRHWKRLVYEALGGCGEVEKKRIEESLRQIDDRLLPRENEWDSNKQWRPNAETEHERSPFRAILAIDNPNNHNEVLLADDIGLPIASALWDVCRSHPVQRTANAFAEKLQVLLCISKQVLFIDPYFGPENGRHRRPLSQFMAAIVHNRTIPLPTTIEFHLDNRSKASFFHPECEKQIPPLVPSGLCVEFIRWEKDDLHNRYILTDRGGVKFGQGLDEGENPSEDLITLLDRETCKKLMQDYSRPSPKLRFVDSNKIEGVRAMS